MIRQWLIRSGMCSLLMVAAACGDKTPAPQYFDPNAQNQQTSPPVAAPTPPVPAAPAAPAPASPAPTTAPPAPPPAAPERGPVPAPTAAPTAPQSAVYLVSPSGTTTQTAPEPFGREERTGAETAKRAIGPHTSNADLMALLRDHENKYIRGYAAETLGDRQAAEAGDALHAAMDDSEPYVQRRAAMGFARLHPCEVPQSLLDRLESERAKTRYFAIGATTEVLQRCLAGTFPDVGPLQDILARLVKDSSADVRTEAILLYGRLRDPDRTEARHAALHEALQDDSASVRQAAILALQDQITDTSIPLLIALLDDDDELVQKAAIVALASSGSTEGLEAVRARLNHPNPQFRARAVQALGELGDAESVNDVFPLLEDRDTSVRLAAVKALGKLATPETLGSLTGPLEDHEAIVRMTAAHTLAELCPQENRAVARALATALADRDTRVALEALQALRCIRSRDNVPELIEALCKARDSSIEKEIADLLERTTHDHPDPTCSAWKEWLAGDGATWQH